MLRDKLYYLLNSNLQDDTTYHIAEYLMENMGKIGEISICQLAETCHVSTATVSRFCKRIGYQNFIDLRDAYEKEMESMFFRTLTHSEDHMLLKNGVNNDVHKISNQLKNSLLELSEKKLDVLVSDIRKHEKIYLIGIDNTFIMYGHIQTELLNLKKYCHVLNYLDERMQTPIKNSMCIIFSMHGIINKTHPEMLDQAQMIFEKSWEITQQCKNGKLDNTLYFGPCEMITADYMAWIYVADAIIYKYKALLLESSPEYKAIEKVSENEKNKADKKIYATLPS